LSRYACFLIHDSLSSGIVVFHYEQIVLATLFAAPELAYPLEQIEDPKAQVSYRGQRMKLSPKTKPRSAHQRGIS
jgi:hypothetical protein